MSPQAFNHGRMTTHAAHTCAPAHNESKTAQKLVSRKRSEQLADLTVKLLGRRKNTILEVRAKIDTNLLLAHIGTKGRQDLTQVLERLE